MYGQNMQGPPPRLPSGSPLSVCPLASHAGRSNALNIAARLGLNPDIIKAARQRLAAGVAAANAAIEELEAIQEEVRQADMLLFAVNANVQSEKVRQGGGCAT
jgi:dsDNA-specific endonuclease/ATPase MutS2